MDSELNIVMDELSSVKLWWFELVTGDTWTEMNGREDFDYVVEIDANITMNKEQERSLKFVDKELKLDVVDRVIMSILVLIRLFFHFVVFVLFDSVSPWLSATAQDLSLGGCLILERDMTKVQRAKDYNAQISTQSSSSHATGEADQGTIRPHGVKAAKGAGKKSTVEEKTLSEFQSMWSIKQHDLLAIKERLSKMSLLDSLLAKKEPLADYEEALNKKLINGLLSS
ncbi:hypothetical protein F2Q70_00015359 [Brassica cretica]|uniref:Uncharacterized protein n=1 Tax=Brassica cretica TaxID=69181 RepID=A0A8S9I1Z6_BRACR|nr:hypothetical protein F2Q70_00015359 [Brassica cretica]